MLGGVLRSIPETPRHGANYSETKLFEALAGRGADKPWTMVHSILIGRDPDVIVGEADFFVLAPGKGIVAIEAKSPSSVKYEGGEWFLEGTPNPKKNPLDQANRARGAMSKFLAELGFDSNIPVARMVWFTSLGRHEFDPQSKGDFQFHEWELAWKPDLAKPIEAIELVLDRFIEHYSHSTIFDYKPELFTEEVAKRVTDSLFADFSISENPQDQIDARAAERFKLVKEQSEILDSLEDNLHIYLEGSAGTGKSFLITEAAKRSKNAGKRTLVTCWNILMAEELGKFMPHSRDMNFVVKDINALMLDFAGLTKNPEDAGSEWYEQTLPQRALAGLKARPFNGRFSSIFIDEFQDLVGKPKVLEFVLALGKNQDLSETTLILAGDEKQKILVDAKDAAGAFETAKALVPGLVKYKLKTNTRMTPKLHREMVELLELKLDVDKHRLTNDKTGGLTVIETNKKDQEKELKRVLVELLSTYSPSDIRVLSPFGVQSSVLGKVFLEDAKTAEAKWLKNAVKHESTKGEIRWRSIPKFKGLESEVVVITDIGEEAVEFFNSRGQSPSDWLYVGISRARHRCILIATRSVNELLKTDRTD
jgi:superfamily I DNA/RNA helicase